MHKVFVLLLLLACGCTAPDEGMPVSENGMTEHHTWQVGDRWEYLAMVPGHPDRSSGVWTFEIMEPAAVDGREVVALEKKFVWQNQTAYLIKEFRDPGTLGMVRREVINPSYNKTDYIEVFDYPVGSIHYPLSVGKSWEDYSAYDRWKPELSRENYSVRGYLKTSIGISGKEVVETPAGTFDTFVMEVNEVEDGEQVFKGRMYFSPEVGKYVKLEGGKLTQVLGNYSIASD